MRYRHPAATEQFLAFPMVEFLAAVCLAGQCGRLRQGLIASGADLFEERFHDLSKSEALECFPSSREEAAAFRSCLR